MRHVVSTAVDDADKRCFEPVDFDCGDKESDGRDFNTIGMCDGMVYRFAALQRRKGDRMMLQLRCDVRSRI